MNNQESLDLLKKVININTVVSNEKEVADLLQDLMEGYGIVCEQVVYREEPTRTQLIATLDSGKPGKTLGFTGHMDVVPVGGIAWDTDPFEATEIDGKLYGRGTADMKSGLIAQVVATIRLKEANLPTSGKLKLLICAAEESGILGSDDLTAAGFADDLDGLVIGEPTDLKIVRAHKGAYLLDVTSYGQTAHGSLPELGINAVDNLMIAVNEIRNALDLDYTDEVVGKSSISLNGFHGGSSMNVVPDMATATFDIRTVGGQDHSKLTAQAQAVIDRLASEKTGFKAVLTVRVDLLPVSTAVEDPIVKMAKDAVANHSDRTGEISGISGATDGSRFTRAGDFPIIVLGPGEMAMAHQPNEYVDIEDFFAMIEINTVLAKEFLK